jgi:NADPH:quinone reductase-like Zn-dependent oxidoreductase
MVYKLPIIQNRNVRFFKGPIFRIENGSTSEGVEMKAAVLHSFGEPPRFESFAEPAPTEEEVLVHVRAAALNPSTRLLASGQHYASPQMLPGVCGVEGVGHLHSGARVFFGVRRPPNGSMCQRTAVPRSFCWPVPEAVDDVIAAALPNPALSSWLPLITTAGLARGENVLILGGTGVAGRLAIQIAKHLGAGRVIAAGRNQDILSVLHKLGADAIIRLDQSDDELAEAFSQEADVRSFDVVLDFLWGHPVEVLLTAMTRKGFPSPRAGTRLIQIGDSAGPVISLPALALRGAAITIAGSGVMPPLSVLSETLSRVFVLAAHHQLHIDVEPVPLADIENVWAHGDLDGRRVVIVP